MLIVNKIVNTMFVSKYLVYKENYKKYFFQNFNMTKEYIKYSKYIIKFKEMILKVNMKII